MRKFCELPNKKRNLSFIKRINELSFFDTLRNKYSLKIDISDYHSAKHTFENAKNRATGDVHLSLKLKDGRTTGIDLFFVNKKDGLYIRYISYYYNSEKDYLSGYLKYNDNIVKNLSKMIERYLDVFEF